MLEEEGVVRDVIGDKALVLTERKGACAQCRAREACHMIEEGKEVLAQALNPVGAEVGDRVKMTLHETALLKSSLVLYFIPALGLIVGSVFGYYLGKLYGWNLDLSAMLGGLLVLGFSFLVIFVLNPRLTKDKAYLPQIEEIIVHGGPEVLDDVSLPETQKRE